MQHTPRRDSPVIATTAPGKTRRSLIPLVLRPRLVSFKNRILRRGGPAASDTLATILTGCLMLGLYVCCSATIAEWQRQSHATGSTASLIGGALGALCLLVLLSSSVSAMSSLFVSRDVERFLASPISSRSFLIGKTLEVGVSTVWMLAVFFVPLYLAFGVAFHAHYLYFTVTPVLVVLTLSCAVLAGMLVAILFSAMIPVRVGRNIFVALFVLSLGVMLASLRMLPSDSLVALVTSKDHSPFSDALLHQRALPSYWMGVSLQQLVHGDCAPAATFIATTALFLLALWKLLLLAFSKVFYPTYSKLQDVSRPLLIRNSSRNIAWLRRTLIRNRRLGALVAREFVSFTRDITHTIQLGMLLAICLLYLYSLRSLEPPTHVGTITLQLWDMCTIFSSILLSSIIILSICARFVFPSVSLEGQSLWILQTAPMRSRDILRAKHLCWFIPTSIMAAIIFSSGGFALGLAPILVFALCAVGVVFSYGLVALGVGIGARFARFDWEHPTELSTSWGNLVYTTFGLLIISVSLLPVGVMFGLFVFFPNYFQDTTSQVVTVATGLGCIGLIHFITGHVMLRIGAQALDGLQRQ